MANKLQIIQLPVAIILETYNLTLMVTTNSRKKKITKFDHAHELKLKDLISQAQHNGYVVRREELKKGLGWKAASGSCRVFDQKVVFLDRSLTQLEQIEFLQGFISKAA